MICRAHLGLVLGSLLVIASACRKPGDGAPCGAVAAHLLVVAQAELRDANVAPALRQRVSMQLPALRDAVDAACSQGGWALAVRRCMVAAPDGAALAACQRDLTPQQRLTLDRAATSASP